MKIAITRVTCTMHEGRDIYGGNEYKTISEAESILKTLSIVTKPGDMNKVFFDIEWEDGRKIEARVDVRRDRSLYKGAIREYILSISSYFLEKDPDYDEKAEFYRAIQDGRYSLEDE